MATNFFSALVSGYSGQMLEKHTLERKQRHDALTSELDTLVSAAVSGNVKPEAMDSVKQRIDQIQQEIAGGKGKGKEGGFHISNLIGKFQDTGGSQPGSTGKTQAKGGAARQSNVSGAAAPAATPSLSLGQPPSRGDVSRGTFGDIVTRGLKTPQEQASEKIDSQIQADIKEVRARATSLSQDLFGKDISQLNPQEKQQVIRFAYNIPDIKVHPVAIAGPDGQPVPALQHDDGTVIGPDGTVVTNPTMWKAPPKMEQRVNILPGGKLQPVYVNPQTHEVFDANTNEKVDKPSLAPPASYLPTTHATTTVEPSVAVDPSTGQVKTGPAITRKTTTTSSKEIPGGPPTRQGGATWAEPKPRGNPNAMVNSTLSTFKTQLAEANREAAAAKKQADALAKESRQEGLGKKIEHGVGIGSTQNVTAAQKAYQQAQAKATNAQKAVRYIESMRQSVIDGTVQMGDVEKAAQQLADHGYTDFKPPGPVTRKVS